MLSLGSTKAVMAECGYWHIKSLYQVLMCSNKALLRQALQDASVGQMSRQDTRQPPAPTTIVSSGDPQMADLRRCTPRGP